MTESEKKVYEALKDFGLKTNVNSLSKLDAEQADEIATNALLYLRKHNRNLEKENKASIAIDFTYKSLSNKSKIAVLCAYSTIYCDTSRKDHDPQKKFANKIFSDIKPEQRWRTIRNEVLDYMEKYKTDALIYSEGSDEYILKDVIKKVKQKFAKIISESKPKNLSKELKTMYKNT